MDSAILDLQARLEDSHWWFVGQRAIIRRLMRTHLSPPHDRRCLDVGCGTGRNLAWLADYGVAFGMDLSADAAEYWRRDGRSRVIQGDIMAFPVRDDVFDAVMAQSLFYHRDVTDDVAGLREIHRILKPGGRLFIVDSAMMSLYGDHDRAFDGVRRYSRPQLKEALIAAGFTIERLGYTGSYLYPLVYLKRKLCRTASRSATDLPARPGGLFNAMLAMLYKIGLRAELMMSVPFGVNIYAVACKK